MKESRDREREQAWQQAAEALDRWCDQMIQGLRGLGLANMPLSYSNLLELTTFGNSHLSEGDYVLHKDGFGNVLGIEAGARYQCDDLWLEDKDKGKAATAIAIAKHREHARIEFPVTAEQLVRWVWGQGGDVELHAADIDDLVTQLRVLTGSQEATGTASKKRGKGTPRETLPGSEIDRAADDIKSRSSKAILRRLHEYAEKSSLDLTLRNGKVGYMRAGSFQEIDRKTITDHFGYRKRRNKA